MSVTVHTVHTQTELDAALAAKERTVYIDSPSGDWLTLRDSGTSHVVAWGTSYVEARGTSHVEARGTSYVEAWGTSHVMAWGPSHVVARGTSYVEARGTSHVVAWGTSHVVAWDTSHVEAWDTSHVEAWDTSHVVAWDTSHVEAGSHVAIHLHSSQVELSGGVVIDCINLDLSDKNTWLAYHGVKVDDGKAVVYKAVDADLNAGSEHTPTRYPIGGTVVATDWAPTSCCGQGLHFGLTPAHALTYYSGDGDARFLACHVDAATLIPLDDKCKAPSCDVLYEVNQYGVRISDPAAVTP